MKTQIKITLLFILVVLIVAISTIVFGQANTWPDYRGNMIGVPMSSGGELVNGIIYCEPPVSDTAPMICYFQGADAWPYAAVNQTGGNMSICAGLGSRQITIDNFANCAGDNVGITVDGTLVTLTEGAQWNAGASNNDACVSLAAGINASVLGPFVVADCPGGGAALYLTMIPEICTLTMTESDATCTTLTQGADGYITVSDLIPAVANSTSIGLTTNRFYRMQASSGFQTANMFLLESNGIKNGDALYYSWGVRSRMWSPSDGNIEFTNLAGNDFGLLQFGGTTNAYPAWKRSGTTIQARLADDSNYAILQGYNIVSANNISFTYDGNTYLISNNDIMIIAAGGEFSLQVKEGEFAAGETTVLWDPCTFANLGAADNGTMCYCSDCTWANPCAGAGTGAFAKRVNAAWRCD